MSIGGLRHAIPRQSEKRRAPFRAGLRLHALHPRRGRHRPGQGQPGAGPGAGEGRELLRHRLHLPRQRGLPGGVHQGLRLPRQAEHRHEAAPVPGEQARGLRPLLRRGAGAAGHRPRGLLPDAHAQRRRQLGAPEGPWRGGMDRPEEGRGRDPQHRLLVPRRHAAIQGAGGRLRLGLLPDPVQLHGRAQPGGRGRAGIRRGEGPAGDHHGAAAGRQAGGRPAPGGQEGLRRGAARAQPRGLGPALGVEPSPGHGGALRHERREPGGGELPHRRRGHAGPPLPRGAGRL